jgi:hypothetical protein
MRLVELHNLLTAIDKIRLGAEREHIESQRRRLITPA